MAPTNDEARELASDDDDTFDPEAIVARYLDCHYDGEEPEGWSEMTPRQKEAIAAEFDRRSEKARRFARDLLYGTGNW